MSVTKHQMKRSNHRDFIIESLGCRIQSYYPTASVQIGTGNTDASIVVVQSHTKMPERDAITGALKNFGMLNDAYRATSMIVELDPELNEHNLNRYYLKELLEIIRPLMVVTCGPEATAILRERKIRSFTSHTGKKFQVEDLTDPVFYATLNPVDYGFARASRALKEQGKAEWTKLASIYNKLKEKQEKERWAC